MYCIEMCRENGNWFSIWESKDGGDCAIYLRNCVVGDSRPNVKYRMIFIPT